MRQTWSMELQGDHAPGTDVCHIHTHSLAHLGVGRSRGSRDGDDRHQNKTVAEGHGLRVLC